MKYSPLEVGIVDRESLTLVMIFKILTMYYLTYFLSMNSEIVDHFLVFSSYLGENKYGDTKLI